MRNALVYVLMNFRKHTGSYDEEVDAMSSLDSCSSAAWFDGWHSRAGPMLAHMKKSLGALDLIERPVAEPASWLATVGWRRAGLILPTERPRTAG